MADTCKTTADVIAWLRRPREGENAYLTAWRDEIADRLEAAHKREVDALKQRCAELVAEVAAKDEVIKRLNDAIAEEQRRKMATTEKSSAVGNAAKLREALTKILNLTNSLDENCAVDPVEIRDIAKAALAEPVRNCDRFGVREEAWAAFRREYKGDYEVLEMRNMFDEWLFAPATEKEGGNDGDK